MSRPRLGFALAGAMCVALVACAKEPAGEKPAASSVAAPKAPPEARPELDARTRGWDLGRRYGYRVKLTTTLAFGDAPNAYDFELSAELAAVPVTVTPETATVYLALNAAEITSRVPGSQAELDKIAKELRAIGDFVALSGGRVTELRFPRGQSPMATTVYRQVAAGLQFAHATAGAERYTATEYDTTGQYEAKYELLPDGSGWSKKKLRYLGLLGADHAPKGSPIPVSPSTTSDGRVVLAGDGRPAVVSLHDQVTLNGAQMPVHSSVALELEQGADLPPPRDPPEWAPLLAATERVAASDPIATPTPTAALDSARVGELDFDGILARLEQIAKERESGRAKQDQALATQDAETGQAQTAPLTPEEQTKHDAEVREDSRLFVALAALLRQKPETARRATQAIHRKSLATPVLMDALAAASTTEAQRALIALIHGHDLERKLRGHAINALARTPKPNALAIAALKELLRDEPFNRKAVYGLGTFSLALRDAGKAKEAAELGEFLLTELKSAQNPLDIVTVLRGIANSGYAGALGAVLPLLDDRRDRVRMAAVRALQSMQDPKADGLIAERIRHDTSDDVRISAVAAAEVREPNGDLASAVVKAGTDAADARVRYRAVELMIRWLPARPELRAALAQVASSDHESTVRDRAKAAL